jgi:hypothetical protein
MTKPIILKFKERGIEGKSELGGKDTLKSNRRVLEEKSEFGGKAISRITS